MGHLAMVCVMNAGLQEGSPKKVHTPIMENVTVTPLCTVGTECDAVIEKGDEGDLDKGFR